MSARNQPGQRRGTTSAGGRADGFSSDTPRVQQPKLKSKSKAKSKGKSRRMTNRGAERIGVGGWDASQVGPQVGQRDGVAALSGFSEGLDAKVLVLNRGYSPVRIVPARRAFLLLAKSDAEVIHHEQGRYVNYDFESWTEIGELQRELEHDQHDWVRTVRMHIAVPRIIRLLGYDRLPVQRVKLNRRNLFARDRNQCQYCGRFFPTSELSIDHVLPRTQGGGDSWENLVCSCVRCNSTKGGRTPAQAGIKLIRKPVRPRRHPLLTIRLGNDKYASWKAFLDDAYWSVELC
jgi:5-methylcytosine-specific restriction endonuclease McrA